MRILLNCIKVKCETHSSGSGIFVVVGVCHHHLYRYDMVTVSVDCRIDSVPIVTVSSQPY